MEDVRARREVEDRREGDEMERHELRITRCRSCRAQVVWLDNPAGPERKRMITDADSVEPGDVVFDRERHVSHFETCPDADRWRKRSRAGRGGGR